MEQRVKNLEDLCELITKEVVEQNKNMIEMNKNLINEIRALREAYIKQDDDFEEFKNLLRKIYELNRQNSVPPAIFPPPPPPPSMLAGMPPQAPTQPLSMPPNYPMNASLLDQINQSMLNNLSFQSVQTPMHQNQIPSTCTNLNTTSSNYSIPSSASAMMNQKSQQPSQSSSLQDLQKPQMPIFNPSQPPPNLFQTKPVQNQPQPQPQAQPQIQQQIQPQLQQQPQPQLQQQPQQPALFKFQPSINTTSTPQTNQFAFKQFSQQSQQPQTQSLPTQVQAEKPKPPQFELSPSKPLIDQTNKPQSIQTSTNNNLFSGINLFKPLEQPKQPEPPKFSFGPGTNLFKVPEPNKLIQEEKKTEEEEEGSHAPEEYEPQIDFKPIVQLKEVEVKTGEEDEDVLLKLRCKLFRFDSESKEWKEKGLGDIKLLKHKKTGIIRVLMRREQVLKLCANHRIGVDTKLNEISPKQLSWMAIDFSDNNEGKTELLLAKFKNQEEASQFKTEFEKSVQAMKLLDKSPTKPVAPVVKISSDKPLLSQQFKDDGWKCTGCYAPNKKDDIKCACCSTPKPGSLSVQPSLVPNLTQEPPKAASQPFNFGTQPKPFSFGLNTTEQSKQQPPKFDFSAKENIFKTAPSPALAPASVPVPAPTNNNTSTSFFGPKPEQTGQQPVLFEKSSMPTFASLASKTSGTLFGNNDSSVSASPIFKPLGFGGALQPQETPKPLFTSQVQAQAQTPQTQEEEETGENQNPEEYEPQVDFKPLVKLQEVEVKTGEENEEPVFKQRCKLYRYDSNTKEWKEKGIGEIKVLKHKTNENMYRILMRRDQVLKLCANHRVTPDLKLEIFNEKQVRWYAQDYSDGEGKHELLAVKFKSEEDAKKFKQAVEDAQKYVSSEPKKSEAKPQEVNKCEGLKPMLKDLFKKEDQWSCSGCLVNNKNDVYKCLACGTERKDASGKPVQVPASATTTTNTTPQTQSQPKFPFGLKTPPQAPISFGTQNKTESLFKAPAFGTSNQTQSENIFTAKPGLSFADLAKNTPQSGFSGGFASQGTSSSLFSTAGFKPAPLFGAKTQPTKEEGEEETGENQNPEEYEPQVEFKPLVKLQEVDVKTGEEDEQILFKQRCKLYRFDSKTKEWKEKGVGEIKILKHKQKENTFRILMRRDQVLKICANHRITPNLKLETVNEKQLRWMANDYSESEPQTELLAVRFRNEEECKRFKEEFEKCQELSKNAPVSAPVSFTPVQPQNSLANLVKKEEGTWSCTGCLAQNKPDAQKCVCCATEKPKNGLKENDVEVVYTAKATDEQIEKARMLKLPDSFYLYEKKPACQGCRGCENEE